MEIKTKAILLTALSKPWTMGERSGVSHKVRLSVNGEIFSANSTEEFVKKFADKKGVEGTAVFNFTSPKELLKLSLVSFEE